MIHVMTCDPPMTLVPLLTLVDSTDSPTPARRSTRVLVVDDYVDTADVMELFLTRAGYEVRAAYCGEDALKLASGFNPDLAIIDIRLPDMSGYELARRLRAEAGTRPLRLVALSGRADPAEAMEARFDEIVCKPVTGSELRRLVHAHAVAAATALAAARAAHAG